METNTNQENASLDIPVIDLSNQDEELVARAVVKASEEWGIFQVVNHGIPPELIRRLQEVGKKFFELPEAEKEAVSKPKDSMDTEGYRTMYQKDLEGRDAWVDHLFHRIWPPSRVTYRFWPKNPREYIEVNEEYASHLKKLSEKIMEWLSEGLGLRREALKEGLGGEMVEYLMKINYYPPCIDPDLVVGAPDHTDVNGITLLVANEALGLQAFKDDLWIDAKCNPSGIIVIIGDQILRMSNGKYKSVQHRATRDKEKTRISWPVFVESSLDHVFGPLPELISGEDSAPKFKPYVYKDFKFRKLKKLSLD
ncbi:PREDICTED: flavonol synthase 3-like [Camelina sativa]|uniref:Flavonol synthase 3-like n=1 Tax=Camelina sativa TaxID=90675 RepID=A0ABM0UPS0_CAMSA|nr:PREDICTED: flavonol synthase 3-like [Camelina sativa]